jgi:membrane protease subunit HflC
MTQRSKIILIAAFVIVFLLFTCFFTVTEGQEALLLRLGRLVSNADTKQAKVYLPGLHAKLPFLDSPMKFDERLQTLDIQSSRIVTAEKKDVIVDYYVKWKISNVPLYYKRTSGNAERVSTLLTQQLNDSLRAQFGRRKIRDVVSDDREQIMSALNQKADLSAKKLGIEVVDVRIKRIDLPEEVSNAVYERMRAERERVAKEHRSQGKAKAEAVRALADAEATIIVAKAKAKGNELRAEGDSQSSKIYSDAYSRDSEFYAFLRSLQAYSQSFVNKQDILVITPDSQFFKYFNNPSSAQTAQK